MFPWLRGYCRSAKYMNVVAQLRKPVDVMRVMASRSAVTDYISIILRAIEKAENDPVQLRRLVYDIARIGLGKQVLLSYQELGSAGLQQQLSDLETAIKEVEILSRLEGDLIPHDAQVPLLEAPASSAERTAVAVRDHPGDAEADDRRQHETPVVASPTSLQIYRDEGAVAEILPPLRVWETFASRSDKRRTADRFRKFELPIAVLIGIAIYAITLMRPDYFHNIAVPFFMQVHGKATQLPANAHPSQAQTTPPLDANVTTVPAPNLGFPLPSVYGVYAVSEGKLYGLESLAMNVPDPRVAISAMISSPSHVTLPDGKLKFVVYRRDLVSSAPDTISIRVVAEVMREMKFAEAGPPKMIKINGEWAIRGKSYQFGVAPVNNHPEMVMVRPEDSKFSFPSGRYVLVLKDKGYDFNVAGQIIDPAHCLERTDAVGGIVYSECPNSL